ncbi:MAG: hypothetical protein JNG90_04855 [Planctomycetaceae bacterium]|nr:hypothetical protein [Planctomycetaceae bacterium]
MAERNQKPAWKLNTDASLREYPCGVKAGDVLLLRAELVSTTAGVPNGKVYAAGSEWIVLVGFSTEPNTVWFRNPNGDNHTWDDYDIWKDFTRK